MKRNIQSFIIFAFISTIFAFAQGDNDYQHFAKRAQEILGKDVDDMSKTDSTNLDNIIKTSSTAFGEDNAILVEKFIKQAKAKKKEYTDFLASKGKLSSTLDELDEESDLRHLAELRGDSLYSENMDLKKIIADLQNKIAKFEKQTETLEVANKKLQTQNLTAAALLAESSEMVRKMIILMPSLNMGQSGLDNVPATLKDSLTEAQCGVAQLLKNNFLITLQQLQANQPFMDTAAAYFKLNSRHSAEIVSYQDNCNALVDKLRRSGIDCAKDYANDIENEMKGFLLSIESKSDEGGSFGDFILNNISWIAPIFLVILIGIAIILKKTSTNNDKIA